MPGRLTTVRGKKGNQEPIHELVSISASICMKTLTHGMQEMSDELLWSLSETARQLGSVSTRTVQRLIARGELSSVRVRRSVKVNASSVRNYVARNMLPAHNVKHAGPDVRAKGGKRTCRNADGETRTESMNVLTLPTTGRRTSTQAARELDALLASGNQSRVARKRKRCSQNGG